MHDRTTDLARFGVCDAQESDPSPASAMDRICGALGFLALVIMLLVAAL